LQKSPFASGSLDPRPDHDQRRLSRRLIEKRPGTEVSQIDQGQVHPERSRRAVSIVPSTTSRIPLFLASSPGDRPLCAFVLLAYP
jgi:hypothetical protein